MSEQNKTLLVAVTGRSGSGKSTVSGYYRAQGFPLTDGDEVSRQVTLPGSPCLTELAGAFGEEIVRADGSLDRKKLGRLAFADPAKNKQLIDITHRYITEEVLRQKRQAQQEGQPLFFVDGAMVVGVPFQVICDKFVVVTAELRLSVSRIILRDGISKQAAYQRLEAQQPEEVLLAAADYVIPNNGTEAALLQRAGEVLEQLLALGKKDGETTG